MCCCCVRVQDGWHHAQVRCAGPAELFAARSREQSIPQRSHGQKDFLPDGSRTQEEKLQICRAEQWELLTEERVERLGSLGRGVWKPEEELVELTLPAGKFWQNMGFTEGGRQCLLPEEAVYLLECGSIQLFYRDLPMSVQEAYQKLLSAGRVRLLHYQVYSHLKRLGYIVTRFDPSSIQLPYERQINLERRAGSSRKRKRSPTRPRLETQNESDTSGSNSREESNSSKPKRPPYPEPVTSCAPNPITVEPDVLENIKVEKKAKNTSPLQTKETDCDEETVKSPRDYRWDFSKISFPNCANDQPCLNLPDPEPALLPDNVVGRQVDISPWMRRLNLRPEKFSRREQEQWDWEQKYKVSINVDPKVKKCSNWREYKKVLEEREHQRHRERPAHLWASTVRPLLTPGRVTSTASVLEQLTVIGQSTLLEDGKRLQDSQDNPQIDFNLFQADGNSEYKKSKPGKPCAYLCVRSFDEPIPTLRAMKSLAHQSGDVPVVFALVDCGEIAFYTFKDLQLPVDIYP
ncbi:tRNA-splicing endonuclease subunit Sen54 isoform X2 [Engystomops pustulosus]|uniref:tRNA-splicing endonuclease subunit Sen54 isoform X2 n=1 Tax=Engystomops pustulosus TaxID=76066 RepID=UPI003AFA1E92